MQNKLKAAANYTNLDTYGINKPTQRRHCIICYNNAAWLTVHNNCNYSDRPAALRITKINENSNFIDVWPWLLILFTLVYIYTLIDVPLTATTIIILFADKFMCGQKKTTQNMPVALGLAETDDNFISLHHKHIANFVEISQLLLWTWNVERFSFLTTSPGKKLSRVSSQNVGKISSYQVKLSRKKTFHHLNVLTKWSCQEREPFII